MGLWERVRASFGNTTAKAATTRTSRREQQAPKPPPQRLPVPPPQPHHSKLQPHRTARPPQHNTIRVPPEIYVPTPPIFGGRRVPADLRAVREVGGWLARLREAKGMSTFGVRQFTGIDTMTIDRVERAQPGVAVGTVAALRTFLTVLESGKLDPYIRRKRAPRKDRRRPRSARGPVTKTKLPIRDRASLEDTQAVSREIRELVAGKKGVLPSHIARSMGLTHNVVDKLLTGNPHLSSHSVGLARAWVEKVRRGEIDLTALTRKPRARERGPRRAYKPRGSAAEPYTVKAFRNSGISTTPRLNFSDKALKIGERYRVTKIGEEVWRVERENALLLKSTTYPPPGEHPPAPPEFTLTERGAFGHTPELGAPLCPRCGGESYTIEPGVRYRCIGACGFQFQLAQGGDA